MIIEPLTMLVVDVLGRYVIDKGATLVKEAGQSAAQAAAQLFEQVMTRLKADPAEAKNAERFEQNPEDYRTPIGEAIAEKVKSDPDFAAQLAALLEDYKKASNVVDASSIKVGSGAVAMKSSVAAGEGGVAVSGDIQGGINISDKQSKSVLEGDDP